MREAGLGGAAGAVGRLTREVDTPDRGGIDGESAFFSIGFEAVKLVNIFQFFYITFVLDRRNCTLLNSTIILKFIHPSCHYRFCFALEAERFLWSKQCKINKLSSTP